MVPFFDNINYSCWNCC